ncbi:hypothetical protein FJY71_08425 [candidate division WOR-3 bacterium]|nr:hypothetical protein [candidate division WOR-3 bacterium]
MAEAHLDHPGEITWWVGHGPAPILGDCPHTGCEHRDTSTVAWGPDFEHYELVNCMEQGEGKCGGACRGWYAEYPRGEVPPGFPPVRWYGFKAYDAAREHSTTREEAEAEKVRIARERAERRLAAGARVLSTRTSTTLSEDQEAVMAEAERRLRGDDGLAGV